MESKSAVRLPHLVVFIGEGWFLLMREGRGIDYAHITGMLFAVCTSAGVPQTPIGESREGA